MKQGKRQLSSCIQLALRALKLPAIFMLLSAQVTERGLQVKRGSSELLLEVAANRLTGLQKSASGQVDIQVRLACVTLLWTFDPLQPL